jgi:hypothetical protein
MDALARAFRASREVGSEAVLTDPKEASVSFYEKFGFRRLHTGRMLLAMQVIRDLLSERTTGD